MTPFQADSVRALRSLLETRGVEVEFVSRDCRPDDLLSTKEGDEYLQAKVSGHNCTLEIYIYSDEAGFYVDQQWVPFEREDYDSAGDLIEDLTDAVSTHLVPERRQ